MRQVKLGKINLVRMQTQKALPPVIRASKIRASKIRASKIRASKIRASKILQRVVLQGAAMQRKGQGSLLRQNKISDKLAILLQH